MREGSKTWVKDKYTNERIRNEAQTRVQAWVVSGPGGWEARVYYQNLTTQFDDTLDTSC